MWPADVFNSVYCYNNDWDQSKYAFVSAWNGEHHVYYSQKNDNETIKGKYAVLDDNLLWDYNQFGAYAEVETDANGNEYNVIDFLCFWENGANVGWSHPSLFRYHIYVEPYEGMDTTGLQSRTWKGKTYYFKEAYDTIDNSIQDNANIDEQTYPEIEGFTQLTDYYQKDKDGKAIVGTYEYDIMTSYDRNLYQRAYDIYFYYNRTEYQLEFFNETGVEKTEQVKFECPLAAFASYTPSAPVDENGIPIYEAGSHRFAGWYDNPNFEGDPFNFANTAMPAENIILYAKWTPVHRTVRFFLDKASMDEGKTLPEKMAELYAAKHNGASDPNDPYAAKYATLTAVPHGSKITIPETPGASKGYEDVHPYEGYGFIGWFYLNDEGEETAFDPANMPVTRNLDLYAKWSSNVLCPYEIRYILDANGNGKLDADETTAVANPTTGSTLAGNSRTFDAKGNTDLYAAYQEGYFPNVASHTIDFKASDKGGVVFTFLYKSNDPVSYTVRYLEKGTDKSLADEVTYPENKKAVVTENFKPIAGYMPDKFQKTLVVVPGGENVIIFYYTVDEDHAPYQVNHYIQNLDGSTWSLYRNADFTGDINMSYSGDAITITGFTYSVSETTEYNETQKINAYTSDALPGDVTVSGSTVSGTLTGNGMQLNLYYTRNTHRYKVQYLEYGTNNPLADEKTVSGIYYNQNVTETAITIQKDMDGDGKYEDFQLYEPKDPSQSATITDNTKVFVFYYVRCTAESLSVTKVVEGNGADADQTFNFTLTSTATDFATVSNGSYAYEIKAGETVVYANYKHVDETSKAITFSLKAGQTITFAGLPTAVYTVAELTDDLPLGYYYKGIAPTQPVTLTKGAEETITVTNTYEPAQLEIKKIVNRVENVTDNVTDFEFRIDIPETQIESFSYILTTVTKTGTETKTTTSNESAYVEHDANGYFMVITLQDQQTALFTNLPTTGEYTVAEKDYTSEGYSAKYEDSDATNGTTTDGKVTLVRGQKDTVTCTNAYPVGSLTLTKIVNKAYEPDTWPLNMRTGQAQEFTFTFTIIRTDANLTVGNSYPVYRGTENIGTVTVENIPVNDETKPALVYQLKYSDFGSQTVKFDNLPKGSYTVLENEDTSGSFTQSDRSIDTSISPEDYAGTVTFTNTYKKHKGDLKITKTVETVGGETAPADAVFTFKIGGTCVEVGKSYAYSIDGVKQTDTIEPDGNNNLYVTLKAGQTAVIHDLNADAFTIYEENIPAGFLKTAETRTAADGNKIFANDPEKNLADATHVHFTNTYVHRGDLKVTKYISRGVYDHVTIDEGKEFTFTLALKYSVAKQESYAAKIYNADNTVAQDNIELTLPANAAEGANGYKVLTSFTLKHGQYIVIEDLPAVKYTISETQETGYLAPMFRNAPLKEDPTYDADVSTGVIAANNGLKDIICYNYIEMLPGDLVISKTINDATPNHIAPKDAAFKFNVTFRNINGTPIETQPYTVEYTWDRSKGTLAYVDGVPYYTPNGAGTSATVALPATVNLAFELDDEYSFTLKLFDGMTARVRNLPASICYVEENLEADSGFGATYNKQASPVGGVAGSDGEVPDAVIECTNTYPVNANGVLKIKKQITKDYERDVVPGDTFTFTVRPTDGNVLSGEYTVKIATDTPLAPATTESKVTAADNKLVVKISFTKEELSGLGLNDSRTKILSIENLPMGAYEIVENLDEDYRQEPANRTLVVNATANPQEAVFINRYKRHLGTLTITKTGADPIDENQSFVFTVTSGSISIPVVLNSENHFEATLSELPFGTYTITEDSSWSWRYTLAANQPGSAEIDGQHPDVTVNIANDRTRTKWLNGAAFESNWFTARTN